MNSTKLFLYSPGKMADVSAKRRRRRVPSSSLAKLKTKVNGWIAKGGLTAIDVVSVEQANACPHTWIPNLNGIIWMSLSR